MANVNVLVFIHGVVEDTVATNHKEQYAALLQKLRQIKPEIAAKIPDSQFVGVEWGHKPLPAAGALLDDEKLTDAENTILAATKYSVISQASERTADDSYLNGWANLIDAAQRAVIRPTVAPIKETVVTLGVTDAFYYASPDGENAIRSHVYSEVLALLDNFRDDQVAVHLIGHSQGATIGFDFLFGLIAPGHNPGFVADSQGTQVDRDRYTFWRDKAQKGELVLGSKSSFGSQIAIMMIRKQSLVNQMAAGQKLDPTVIGVPRRLAAPADPPKWKIFYDTDDLLGYPARRIFDTVGTIKEYQVDSSPNPVVSHTLYWTNGEVQTEIANLIAANLI